MGEILVDLRDAWAVREALRIVAPGVQWEALETSTGLGLARVRLHGVAEAAAQLRSAGPATSGDTATSGAIATSGAGGIAGGPAADVDVVLAAVRGRSREAYHGWCPAVDRDRDDLEVETDPHVKIAIGDAEAVEPADGDRVPPGDPAGPRVGVADTVVFAHDDLAGRYLGRPHPRTVAPPTLGPGHSTFVAGTVLLRHPGAALVCRTVLVHGGPNLSWDVAQRLTAFADDGMDGGVDVLNLSFGWLVDGEPPLALARAVERLAGRCVLVAAVGNHREGPEPTRPLYPAAFPAVLAVGASAPGTPGEPAPFTPRVPWLDVLAPGTDVVGPFLVDEQHPTGYVRWSGSSFAAAAVSGEIARLMAVHREGPHAARDRLLAGEVPDVVPWRAAEALEPLTDAGPGS